MLRSYLANIEDKACWKLDDGREVWGANCLSWGSRASLNARQFDDSSAFFAIVFSSYIGGFFSFVGLRTLCAARVSEPTLDHRGIESRVQDVPMLFRRSWLSDNWSDVLHRLIDRWEF